jgi:LPS O-antigen subunit length determinant protein (WzzB/FepE family)
VLGEKMKNFSDREIQELYETLKISTTSDINKDSIQVAPNISSNRWSITIVTDTRGLEIKNG